ncbi:unnamed protein product [Lupinus luteus]|uniref:Uncharacterized protein n=1 Tax=Lupinus luteus TaxID=3873 RepID=A0AAV1WFI8_LUPLU
MGGGRPKKFKTTANRGRRPESGSSSTQGTRQNRGDPYYSLIRKETRLTKIQGRKPAYVSLSCYHTISSFLGLLIIFALMSLIRSLLSILIRIIWLVGVIHKMGIYKYGNTWKYQEDHTTVDLDISSDEDQTSTEGQNATAQGEPSGTASQEPECLIAYHDNQYQNMRNLVQLSAEAQRTLIQTTAQSQTDLFYAEFQKLTLLIRGDWNMVVPDDSAYPPPPQP